MEASDVTLQTPPPESSPTQVKRKRSTRNLILRGFSAIAAVALVYGSLRWDLANDSGWAWAALVALLSIFCLREFYRLAADCDIQPFSALGFVAGPLYVLATEWDLSGGSARHLAFNASWAVFFLAVTAAMLLQLTRRSNDNALINVAATLFGVIYCAMLPSLNVHFRHMRLGPEGWPMHGVEFVVVCIFISKVSDVGALLTGSRWGKHKLIPRLSPGKTWEGAAGGMIFSILLLQFMTLTAPWMALASLPRWQQALLSILLAAAGLAGDLVESAFKRNSRRKDAGTGVPGFGGMLDLTDSLMVAAPILYFFLVICGADYVK